MGGMDENSVETCGQGPPGRLAKGFDQPFDFMNLQRSGNDGFHAGREARSRYRILAAGLLHVDLPSRRME
jgi:hypothetical protein